MSPVILYILILRKDKHVLSPLYHRHPLYPHPPKGQRISFHRYITVILYILLFRKDKHAAFTAQHKRKPSQESFKNISSFQVLTLACFRLSNPNSNSKSKSFQVLTLACFRPSNPNSKSKSNSKSYSNSNLNELELELELEL